MSTSEYKLQDGYSINISFIYKLFARAEVANEGINYVVSGKASQMSGGILSCTARTSTLVQTVQSF
jgi:predicted sulfurtransferase